ncbi:MarR family winged helix-turn-helix transcriptional regulator [Anaerofustis sp. LCP19S3_F7]|uniref:MarR family winged helix-turn-helix transcriptional regulator n=1 Tax=Anaerofustis sp. LCP19S3_F7 TaxID=3440247 RepID=UPI003F91A5C8
MKAKKEVGMIIKRLSNEISKEMNKKSAAYGITGVQGRIIRFVTQKEGDVFQKDIEACLFYRRSTVTGILNTMEENGLIERVSVDYDARLKKIVVTKKGLCIKSQIEQDIKNMERTLKNGLSKDEIDAFFAITEKILNNFK